MVRRPPDPYTSLSHDENKAPLALEKELVFFWKIMPVIVKPWPAIIFQLFYLINSTTDILKKTVLLKGSITGQRQKN